MKKSINKISIIIICLMHIIIIYCYLSGISPQVILSGVVNESENPKMKLNTVMNGEYQFNYENYFSENFPFRSYFIRSYNQILYNIRSDKDTLIFGKRDSMLDTFYIEQYLKPCTDTIISDTYKYAEKVKQVQDKLESCGKMFYYTISPSKAEIYSEDIPNKYLLNIKKGDKKNSREVLVEAFDKLGVNYIDTTPLMLDLKNNYNVFFKTGIHWNYYAAAVAGKSLLEHINSKYNINLRTPNINVFEQKNPVGSEQDLYQLYNMWKGKSDKYYYGISKDYNGIDYLKDYNLFEMGVSFSNELINSFLDDGNNNAVFNKIVRYNYFVFEQRYDNNGMTTNNSISTESVLKELQDSNIILMENNASYVPESHVQFVDCILKLNDDDIKGNVYQNNLVSGSVIVDFSQNSNSNQYVESGFYNQEEYRWASSDASLVFNFNEKKDIMINIIAAKDANAKTKVYFNNKYICDLETDAQGNFIPIHIESKYLNKNKQHIKLISEGVKSPYEQGINDDKRDLALYMKKVIITAEERSN